MKFPLKLFLLASVIIFSKSSFSQSGTTAERDWYYSYEYTKEGISYINLNGNIIENAFKLTQRSQDLYSFIFLKDGKYYVNICGKEIGPYEYVNNKDIKEASTVFVTDSGSYAFLFSKGGRKYINANGKTLGPFPSVDDKTIKINEDGKCSFSYLKSQNERYAFIDGKQFGPFPNMAEMMCDINKDGSYYYEYTDNSGNYFININGKNHKIEDVNILSYSYIKYYAYKENGKWYIDLNNKKSGPYDEVVLISIDPEVGEYIYRYRINNDWYVNQSGSVSGPFQTVSAVGLSYYIQGTFVFKYTTAKGEFINIAGKIYGPYSYTKSFTMLENGLFAFAFEENRRWYLNINGKIKSGGYGLIDDIYVIEEDLFAFSYRENLKSQDSYILAKNKKFGPYPGYVEEVFMKPGGEILFVNTNMGSSWVDAYGKRYGTFSRVASLNAGRDGEYSFSVFDNKSSKYALYMNERVYGPFDALLWHFSGEGNRSIFTVKLQGQYYVSLNGVISGPFDNVSRLKVFGKWNTYNLLY